MAGKFVYNSVGERVWVEDGTTTGSSTSGDTRDPAGPVAGSPSGKKSQPYGYGVGGLPHYDNNLEAARLLWADSANQNQIKAAHSDAVTMNHDAELATRDRQMAMLAALQTQSAGGGPSAANAMTLEGRDAALRAQMTAGRSGGTISALGGGAQMQAVNAMKGAAAKAQEQQSAYGSLNSAAFGVRGADMQAAIEQSKLNQTNAMANAGFAQQSALANQNAQLAALANRQAAAGAYGGLVADNRTAKTTRWGIGEESKRNDARQVMLDQERQDAQTAEAVRTGATAVALGGSDERIKTDIDPGDGKLRSMLDALTAYEYRYKDPRADGAAPGKHVSVMAQDLERSDLGKRAVTKSDEGHKMVDYGRLAGTQLAATAMLHKRLSALEAKR